VSIFGFAGEASGLLELVSDAVKGTSDGQCRANQDLPVEVTQPMLETGLTLDLILLFSLAVILISSGRDELLPAVYPV
jgi:hypothetical protein